MAKPMIIKAQYLGQYIMKYNRRSLYSGIFLLNTLRAIRKNINVDIYMKKIGASPANMNILIHFILE